MLFIRHYKVDMTLVIITKPMTRGRAAVGIRISLLVFSFRCLPLLKTGLIVTLPTGEIIQKQASLQLLASLKLVLVR